MKAWKGKAPTQFAVIGLGSFGMSIVKTLSTYGVNVLACDHSLDRLHEAAPYATHVLQADAADEDAMERMGLGNFDVVILAMGEDFEASVLATMKAKELGVPRVIVKAYGDRQRKILLSIGADQVVLPEQEMGGKIARRLLRPNLLDILDESAHFSIEEIKPLPEWVGKTVRQSDIRRKQGAMLLAIIRGDKTIIPVQPDETLQAEDLLITLSEGDAGR